MGSWRRYKIKAEKEAEKGETNIGEMRRNKNQLNQKQNGAKNAERSKLYYLCRAGNSTTVQVGEGCLVRGSFSARNIL